MNITKSAPHFVALFHPAQSWLHRHFLRLVLVLLLGVLAIWPGSVGQIARGLMHDAYVGVSVFVGATLLLVYGFERLFRFDLGEFLRQRTRLQVPIAALLGMSPGCAGAIVVTAAYSSGNVSLGALVAALTGTMGDAAFLLIATKPAAAAVLLPVSLVAGILTGLVVDRFHKKHIPGRTSVSCDPRTRIGAIRRRDWLFLALAVPGFGLGLLDAFQVPLGAQASFWALVLSLAGMTVLLWIWLVSPMGAVSNPADPPLVRVVEESSFITIWVLGAYLAYGYVEAFSGLDIGAMFATVAVLMPLIGTLIGFIPGCGPQILVATLYINGLVPFSALVANSISNDGDALFPAIALNPRAALIATIYTSFPAVIVGYGFYFFLPNFMN
jgi:hypothetical protein